jgi:ADP-heptose:LPS heptosyltransferase
MGWGDHLIWLGEAKHLYDKDGIKRRPMLSVRRQFLDPYHNIDYIDLYNGQILPEKINGHRPYVGDPNYVLRPAHLILNKYEEDLSVKERAKGPYWIICPDNKPKQNNGNNKHWGQGPDNWVRLIELIRQDFPGQRILRLKPEYSTDYYPYIENRPSPGCRYAIIMAKRASLIITTEGFWHHLAAAWSVPALVLYGGAISPSPSYLPKHAGMGYDGQWNIVDTTHPKTPCYSKELDCPHCKEVWKRITPELVYDNLLQFIKKQ